jgi:cation:H+ antiporter
VLTAVATFGASGAVVVAAGVWLAREADAIAEETGIGRLWVGTLLLASATSLPELASDVWAVRLGAADLAAGDLFGSSMANMAILALLDLRGRAAARGPATLDHALAACVAIGLNAAAVLLVLARSPLASLGIAPGSLALALAWVAGTRAAHRRARPAATELEAPGRRGAEARARLVRAARRFALAALAILAAAPAFAWSAKRIAELSGLGQSFVGAALLGLSTSLPELVASLAAVRLGAFDLAVGNLFGSNAFNMAVFLPLDLAQPGSIFAALDPVHALTGLLGVVLTSLGLAALILRAERRAALVAPDSLLMLGVYFGGLLLVWSRGAL